MFGFGSGTPEDPWIGIAKQIGIQAAAIIVAVTILFAAYKIFAIISWIGDRIFEILCFFVPLIYGTVVNLGRVVTGLTVLTVLSCLVWIYTQGPSLRSVEQLELLYRFYKETIARIPAF